MSSSAHYDLGTVARALFVHPVKACAGVAVEALQLDARGGVAGDREWAIVDERDEVTWQGAHPRLALVHPRFAGAAVVLAAAGHAELATPPASALRPRRIRIWNDATRVHDTFDAADAGDPAARWLAAVTGAPLRLVRLGEQALAREGPAALHLVFVPSMAAVDAELAAAGRPAADPRRYRANVVLDASSGDGLDAFVEESVQALAWQPRDGGATLRIAVTGPCVRCVVPDVDPATARVDPGTLAAMETLSQRRRPGGATVFGLYARGPAHARLHVGDAARLELAF